MLQRNPDSFSMPTFNMADYFEGRTRAWGMFETITGKVKKSFVADIEGRWDGNDFLLEEDFTIFRWRKGNPHLAAEIQR